jgi:ubiquinol-cytochrome c reductase iron-sulfur subunit
LVRVNLDDFQALPGRENWSPQGYVAYSKICTHAGCPVGLYQPETRELFCPCHQSVFDVADGARPTSGPAARPLPQLPLEIDAEGQLRASGGFSAPVGPSFWSEK